MSDTNVFFAAIQSALDAHIERMVEARVAKELAVLVRRIDVMELDVIEDIRALEEKDAALETRMTALEQPAPADPTPNALSAAAFVTYLDGQEWFWEKLNRFTGAQIEQAIDEHCSTYDHDDYDSVVNEWGGESTSYFVRDEDLSSAVEDKVRDALNNATLSISL